MPSLLYRENDAEICSHVNTHSIEEVIAESECEKSKEQEPEMQDKDTHTSECVCARTGNKTVFIISPIAIACGIWGKSLFGVGQTKMENGAREYHT